jgi:hypothetical protein
MPLMMMRASSGIVCTVAGALSFAVACSWGGAASNNPGPDASSTTRCGDGVCAASEVNSCPADCGTHGSNSGSGSGSNQQNAVCGNNVCEQGETATCPSDCGGGSGSAVGNCPADPTSCISCIFDPTMCPPGLDMNSCLTCLTQGLGGTSGCDGGAPDMICEADETNATCPQDCP